MFIPVSQKSREGKEALLICYKVFVKNERAFYLFAQKALEKTRVFWYDKAKHEGVDSVYKVNKKDEVPIYLFHQGTNYKAYEFLGSHSSKRKGVSGAVFRVWAPHALSVSVVGDFNNWTEPMTRWKKSAKTVCGRYSSRKSNSTICTNTALKHRQATFC